jgi:hypothetical protein
MDMEKLDKMGFRSLSIAEEAMKEFPEEVGISHYGHLKEIADLLAFMVSPAAKWMKVRSSKMDAPRVVRRGD